jgi:hypothetical protein
MEREIKIPLTGAAAETDQIPCQSCGKDSLVSFPIGFYHDGVCFHGDYMSSSYIYCRGDNCGASWIQCFVCNSTHSNKSAHTRHKQTKKHMSNIEAAVVGIKSGTLKTRNGSGSKSAPSGSNAHIPLTGEGRQVAGMDAAPDAVELQENPREVAHNTPPSMSTQPNPKNKASLEQLELVFGLGTTNANFFHKERVNPGSGGEFLLQKAFNLGEDKSVSGDEQRFIFELTKLLLNMSGEDRSRLADILGSVVDMNDGVKGIFKHIRVPRSTRDFDNILLHGKCSLVQNLPCPKIRMTPDGTHAYVSIIDVIAHVLATDTPVEALQSKTSMGHDNTFERYMDFKTEVYTPVSRTTAARILSMELHKGSEGKNVLYLFMKEWSDDFDPSHTKSNRAQVWIKTFTISPPTRKTFGQSRNTCITMIGSKGDDHDAVEELLTEQLLVLSTGEGVLFYHGGLNDIIRVKAGVLTTCVDRPERTKLFGVGDHNGTYSTCWGYATVVDVSGKSNRLPSCHQCRVSRVTEYLQTQVITSNNRVSTSFVGKRIKTEHLDDHDPYEYTSVGEENTESSDDSHTVSGQIDSESIGEDSSASMDHLLKPEGRQCPVHKCASWNILDPHMSFPKPDKFPVKADVGYKGNIPAGRDVKEITSNGQTWLVTINITLDWLQDVALYAFHHINPANKPKGRCQKFWNKQEFTTYCRTCGFTSALALAIENSVKEDKPCPIPTRWTRERALEKCHYAAMHMLFLGHVKSNMDLLSKWLSSNELLAKFGKQVNPFLIQIRDMRMRRFNALPLSTSSWGTGPWVSENYVFWQRALKYFFGFPVVLDNPKFKKPGLRLQLDVAKRFVAASHACISAIMCPSCESSERMRKLIPIYLDTMVEMDCMKKRQWQRRRKRKGLLGKKKIVITTWWGRERR